MKIEEYSFEINNSIDRMVRGDVRSSGKGPRPAAIFLHGLKGFRNWGFIPYSCLRLARAGAIAVNFDFSLNGIRDENRPRFDESDFRRNTLSQELEDALLVIDSIRNGEILSEFDKNNFSGEIYLIGHSLGGGISLIAASQRKINKIALWASVSAFDRYSPRQKHIWRKLGHMNTTVSQTGQKLPIGTDFLDDFEQHREKYDPVMNANRTDAEILVIQPTADVTIAESEARKLAAAAGTEPVFIERAGHTFGAEHPMDEAPEAVDKALDYTIRFFGIK
ncbi:MAG: alpha/beta hydrolase family protein [Candidatus Kapaibacterium sp.]